VEVCTRRRISPLDVTLRTGMKTVRRWPMVARWVIGPGCTTRWSDDATDGETLIGPTTESTASAAAGAATTRSIPQIASTVAR
jgi:hypothetical protein